MLEQYPYSTLFDYTEKIKRRRIVSANNNDLNTKNSRRRFIQTSATIAASALLPNPNLFAATDITGQLAAYMAGVRN